MKDFVLNVRSVGLVILFFVVLSLGTNIVHPPVVYSAGSTGQTTVLKEGNDFATRLLGRPWEMNDFAEISAALNNSGRTDLLNNIQMSNGMFSAKSTSLNNAQFFALFPGYTFELRLGKMGTNYPIPAGYHCFFTRMQVNSPSADDSWYVAWHNAEQNVQLDGGGQSYGMPLQSMDGLPLGSWRMYSVDLSQTGYFYKPWNNQAAWKGLSIHPTNKPFTTFTVDWIRLTDCQPVKYDFSWRSIAGQTRLWAGIGAQQKDIFIGNLSSSTATYTWDVQGIAPGTYYLGIEANGSINWLPNTLTIQAAPIVQFVRPSPYSGKDYATSAGLPWNMSNPNAITRIDCANASFARGLLLLDTPSPLDPNHGCLGGIGEADPKIYFNMPSGSLNGTQYRYLNFRMLIDGSLQEVADGMIGRWIWTVQEPSGAQCTQVGQGIPYDVGWHTYTLDLLDPVQGYPAQASGCGLEPWSNATQVVKLRFDPNENYTGMGYVPAMAFHQEFEWFRLSQMDTVSHGTQFPIQLSLNKPLAQVPSLTYYYTTDPQQPTQHRAPGQPARPIAAPSGTYKIYLPLVVSNTTTSPSSPNSAVYSWDTSNVTPGAYYVCVIANDGYNTSTFCSEAPVVVQ